MTNTLYLLNYNNYSDRTFRKEATANDYLEYLISEFNNINFNPNDGVSTTQIINVLDTYKIPNYCVVLNENGEIDSRWFIVDAIRIRGGQYQYELYRDVVADFTDTVLNSPCFIEKAIIPDNDSAIFNAEDMTFNQIKTKETLIKDKTQVAWLVGYLAREDASGAETAIDETVVPLGTADITANRDSWEYAELIDAANTYNSNVNSYYFNMHFYNKTGFSDPVYLNVNLSKATDGSTPNSSFTTANPGSNYIASSAANMEPSAFDSQFSGTYNNILNYVSTAVNVPLNSTEQINRLIEIDGNTINFTGENEIYQIKVVRETKSIASTEKDTMYTYVQNLWSSILPYADWNNAIAYGNFMDYGITYTAYSIQLVSYGLANTIEYQVPTSRIHLTDAPYDMICAPYDNVTLKIGSESVESIGANMLTVFNDMAMKKAGGENPILYDVQLLPYCPIAALTAVDGVIDTNVWGEATQLYPITQNGATIGAIFGCSVSNFKTWVPLDEPIVITNAKIQSMCDKYRICSPNYNGAFDFNPIMNNGLDGFNIYCTYKPFNPYIQVSPNFGGLYGNNFDDARGLICGGEWSMPIVTSAWETYERQNANYNNIFNRQIENLQTQQDVARTQETVSMLVGALQGGGAALGASVLLGAGLPGIIGAGIAGTAASLGAGIADRALNEKLRHEAIDFAQDQFGYQLGNIKALPNSLSRTSAFTVNNKIFPFLEYYTCTPEEKDALAYKIANNGMTYMRINKIINFISNSWVYNDIYARNYIKGKIIKCEDLNEDYHIAKRLVYEINNGLYFGGK